MKKIISALFCSVLFCSVVTKDGKAGSCVTTKDDSLFTRAMSPSHVFEGRFIENKPTYVTREVNGRTLKGTYNIAMFDISKWHKGSGKNKVSVLLQNDGSIIPGSEYPFSKDNNYIVFTNKLSVPYLSEKEKYFYTHTNCKGDGALLINRSLSIWQKVSLFFGALF